MEVGQPENLSLFILTRSAAFGNRYGGWFSTPHGLFERRVGEQQVCQIAIANKKLGFWIFSEATMVG